MHAPSPSRRPRQRGFTLIELMIAVAIVAILGAVAFPAFMDSMRKSRRAEAFTALSAVQLAQERHRSNRAEFTNDLTSLVTADPPGLGLSTTTPSGYYTIAVSGASATGYIASASAVAGTSQANDGNCARLAVEVNGARVRYASCASCSTFSFAESDTCWKR